MRPSTEDLYNYSRRVPSAFRKLEASSVSEDNKKLIVQFIEHCRSMGLGPSRILKYLTQLHQITQLMNIDLRQAGRNEIQRVVIWVEESHYAELTKRDYKITLKKFYKWLRGDEDEVPKEVRWIKTEVKRRWRKLPEEMLSEEDILSMAKACDNPRDKALVHVLYESGCRIGELARLRLCHVQFDKHGAQITVEGKTGMRRVRLVASVPSLAAWLENHPDRDEHSAPLWTSIGVVKGKVLACPAIAKRLKEIARKAKVKKRIYPHLFRHSRATHLAQHFTESQLKEFFGWTQASTQAATYVHLSGRDVDGAILKLYGMSSAPGSEEPQLKPMRCFRCESMNAPGGRFCTRCGMCLDIKTAVQLEDKRGQWDREMLEFVNDPEVQDLWARKRGRPIASQ